MKKYIGTFQYFATGEGFRVYTTHFTTEDNKNFDPKWVFYTKLQKKFGEDAISFEFVKDNWEYFSHGIQLFDVEDGGWFQKASDNIGGYLTPKIFEAAAKLIREGSMIEGDFEFWYQFNRS